MGVGVEVEVDGERIMWRCRSGSRETRGRCVRIEGKMCYRCGKPWEWLEVHEMREHSEL